mmetsp:Transcript_30452/g.72469  ORF Transcript_30452/g.72469 Transcript_30452/m.72469 type:complete len:476 (-) Transcript_30452:392-1819(-)
MRFVFTRAELLRPSLLQPAIERWGGCCRRLSLRVKCSDGFRETSIFGANNLISYVPRAHIRARNCYAWKSYLRNLGIRASGQDDISASSKYCEGTLQDPYRVINFYHLVDLGEAEAEAERHRDFIEQNRLDLRGRIYVTPQGVNAQYSGTVWDAHRYVDWLRGQAAFAGLSFSSDPVRAHAFPKLRLKHKRHLISLKGGHGHLPVTDPEARAKKLSPGEWREMLADSVRGSGLDEVKRAVVLDVRNDYEWDAGHFEGAARPVEGEFRETPTGAEAPPHLRGVDKDTPVMMYCTGGIRCDVYSPYLRKQGFRKVFALEGGIANYLKQEGAAKWKGSMFVFDDRLAIGPAGGGKIAAASDEGERLPAAVPCQLCGGAEAVLPHLNCANVLCNKLFIACRACSGLPCREAHSGCCCEECTGAPRLRRRRPDGTWEERTQEPAPDSPFLRSMEGPMTHRTRPRVVEPLRPAEAKAAEAL